MSDQTEKKIDELAAMVARGFAEIREEMATKDDIRAVREEMATKDDIKVIRTEMVTKTDLDKAIGFITKSHDELTFRVKKIEEKVFAPS